MDEEEEDELSSDSDSDEGKMHVAIPLVMIYSLLGIQYQSSRHSSHLLDDVLVDVKLTG